MKFLLTLIIFFAVTGSASAQSWLPAFLRDTVDSEYIENLSRRLTIRTLLDTKTFEFSIRHRRGAGPIIRYAPNTTPSIGLGAYYYNLGGVLTVRLMYNKEVRNLRYGETKSFDLQFNGYGPRFSTDLIYQSYKGFYLSNPALFIPNWSSGQPFPQLPNLHIHNIGVNLYYIFNHYKFSYQAAFIQTKRQKKDAGTFLLMTSLWLSDFDNDSILVPEPIRPELGGRTGFEAGKFYTLALMPGYAFTKVHNRFFGTGSISLGPGIQYRKYQLEGDTQDNIGLQPRINVRVAGGYNGENFISGLSVVLDRVTSNFENINIRTNTNNLKLFVAYRF
jgi:hypothetical protein